MPEYIKNSAGLSVRQWPHKNIEQQMQANHRANQARRETEYYNNGNPEGIGSHRKRIDALIIAIRNLNHLDRQPTSMDDGWY